MARDPFTAIRRELERHPDEADDSLARLDFDRLRRTGVPEVIYAESKSDRLLAEAIATALTRSERVTVSRISDDRVDHISVLLGRSDVMVERPNPGSTVVFALSGSTPPPEQGFVAVITAGTSDIDAAGEAATVVREIGCRVEIVADVGVAGLHRLILPLQRVVNDGVDVIIVAAGMDGALPSVVAGLVDVPVIGLPTSVGYGVARGGHAALNTMLSSCAPGLTVVNIDNGIGAGASAARIARRGGPSH